MRTFCARYFLRCLKNETPHTRNRGTPKLTVGHPWYCRTSDVAKYMELAEDDDCPLIPLPHDPNLWDE